MCHTEVAMRLFVLLRLTCDLLCREFQSQVQYPWADGKQGPGLSSEGHQPLGQCPAADREEVWQALYALHSLYEVRASERHLLIAVTCPSPSTPPQ